MAAPPHTPQSRLTPLALLTLCLLLPAASTGFFLVTGTWSGWTCSGTHAAMERAWVSGEPALSGKVILKQEIDEGQQAGFLLYVPVYRQGPSLAPPRSARITTAPSPRLVRIPRES